MTSYLVKRTSLAFVAVVAASFVGFAFAHLGRTVGGNPLFSGFRVAEPLLPAYGAYIGSLLGQGSAEAVAGAHRLAESVGQAAWASLALIVPALLLSLVLGALLGLAGVRRSPPVVRGWLLAFTSIGQATPSFFAGSLAVAGMLALVIWGPLNSTPLPVQGYGLDLHLVLPVAVLAVRPTAFLAQFVASLTVGELGKPYVRTAVGKGLTWEQATRRHALRNVQAPLVAVSTRTLRTIVADLILVEWLFGWPGLGRLLAGTLIPDRMLSSGVEATFLSPPLVASIVALFALFFVLVDLAAAILTRRLDPRSR